MEKRGKIGLGAILFVLYLIGGLYYLNSALKFITLPEAISNFLGSNMGLITAIMLLLGGFFAMSSLKKKPKYPQ